MTQTRRHFLLMSFAGLAACAAAPGDVRLAPGTRLIMVRHADRVQDDLSAKGIARAAALPAALDGIPLDAILSPGIKRNLDTASPLAAARGLPVTRVAQEQPAGTIARLSQGKSVIWVGNKGNLQSIWDDLGLSGLPPLDYGDLFIVTALETGALVVERRRWGPA